jgi:hypothetical protein
MLEPMTEAFLEKVEYAGMGSGIEVGQLKPSLRDH